jgi:3-oxoacyl-[acyl-carrier protein] reductase
LKKPATEGTKVTESMRTVIVTGASRGIGRATAERLARDFGVVVPVARSSEGLASAATRIHEIGAAALPIEQDMREALAANRVVQTVLAATGRIDAIVNVAGAVPQTDLFEMTDEGWADGLSLKFHGARKLTLAAWPALTASSGSVVFMSGTAAPTPKA